ncbi:TetR/AcrR family transcriptional regulator [Streptomyces sp. NRRL F-5126]|uniref:TetR/AcrR family transcriptional regulator n=1 Tax=Streptomyces sp. NRRL F-5126 TaxID=1463857 RepID=UPI0004C75064|nr:TetR/AcrR family transcriptional regulator [Streptomyces sp. NRRL F-5126]
MAVDREHLLRSAAALLARRPAATMDEVARAAGIGRATLHRHFAGRDALVRALESLGIQEIEAALDAADIDAGPAEDALRRFVAAVEPAAGLLAFLVTENQLFEGDVHEGWNRTDARICALFRRGQESGEFRIDLPAAWLAEALSGLISACAWSIQDGRVAARDFTRMTVELLLGGVRRSAQ